MYHTWQARDQPKKVLQDILAKRYKDIDESYKLLKKVSEESDAQKIVSEIWSMKRLCSEIELELLRRSWDDGTQNQN